MSQLLESELYRNIIIVCLVTSIIICIIICLILFCLRRNRRERYRVKPISGVVVEEVNPLRIEKIMRLI